MTAMPKLFGVAMILTVTCSTQIRAQAPSAEPQPFSKSAGGFNLQLTPAEWRSAADIRGAGVATFQNNLTSTWPATKPPPAVLTVEHRPVLDQIRWANGVIAFNGGSFVQIPTTQPDPREGLDLEPLTRVAQRLIDARLATISARASYGPGHASIATAEGVEQDIQLYYDSSTKDLPLNLKIELADRERHLIARALTEVQLARVDAETRYGPEHPTLLKLRKQEASLHELHREKIAQVRELNDKAKASQ